MVDIPIACLSKRRRHQRIKGRGEHAGEQGRVAELYSIDLSGDDRYGVKLLTGPNKDRKGTFVARRRELVETPADDVKIVLVGDESMTFAHDGMSIDEALALLWPYSDPADDPDKVRGQAMATIKAALARR